MHVSVCCVVRKLSSSALTFEPVAHIEQLFAGCIFAVVGRMQRHELFSDVEQEIAVHVREVFPSRHGHCLPLDSKNRSAVLRENIERVSRE